MLSIDRPVALEIYPSSMSMSCGVCGLSNCPCYHHHHSNPAAPAFPVQHQEPPVLEYQFFGHGHAGNNVGTWPPPAPDQHGRPPTFHGLQYPPPAHPAGPNTFEVEAAGQHLELQPQPPAIVSTCVNLCSSSHPSTPKKLAYLSLGSNLA